MQVPRIMATLEFHIDDICKYLESKKCTIPLSPVSSIDEKLRHIKEWVFKQDRTASANKDHGKFGIPSNIKLDQKFSTFVVNVNTLDSLYRDFFDSQTTDPSRFQSVIEVKNRCFKDLYN